MTRATLRGGLAPAMAEGHVRGGPRSASAGGRTPRAYAAPLPRDRGAAPVILQAGPGGAGAHSRSRSGGRVLGREFGRDAVLSVPVVIHLDHGASAAECEAAIAHGFTSVMFDGSRLPLEDNIDQDRAPSRVAPGGWGLLQARSGLSATGRGRGPSSNLYLSAEDERVFAGETGSDAMEETSICARRRGGESTSTALRGTYTSGGNRRCRSLLRRRFRGCRATC